jgi:hypothetical protein
VTAVQLEDAGAIGPDTHEDPLEILICATTFEHPQLGAVNWLLRHMENRVEVAAPVPSCPAESMTTGRASALPVVVPRTPAMNVLVCVPCRPR